MTDAIHRRTLNERRERSSKHVQQVTHICTGSSNIYIYGIVCFTFSIPVEFSPPPGPRLSNSAAACDTPVSPDPPTSAERRPPPSAAPA